MHLKLAPNSSITVRQPWIKRFAISNAAQPRRTNELVLVTSKCCANFFVSSCPSVASPGEEADGLSPQLLSHGLDFECKCKPLIGARYFLKLEIKPLISDTCVSFDLFQYYHSWVCFCFADIFKKLCNAFKWWKCPCRPGTRINLKHELEI